MFVQHGLALTAIGIVIGLAVAVGLTRMMSALLYAVSPVDPVDLWRCRDRPGSGSIAGPGYLPARRATVVDPVQALKFE